MTKSELIQYSTEEVRKTPHLFLEFERIFREENGHGCSGCHVKYVLDSWRSQLNKKNNNKMANTFILAKPNALYRVDPDTVLSKSSSDEVALQWLSLKTYGGNATKKENLEKIFKKLPAGYGKTEEKAEAEPKTAAKKTTTKK